MNPFLFALGYVWSLPLTVLGFVLAIVTGCVPIRVYEGMVVYRAGPGINWFFERTNIIAFTWSGCCIIRADYNPHAIPFLLAHEVVHFHQAMVLGPFMPLAYAVCIVTAWAQGGHWWRENALEIQAVKKADDFIASQRKG